MSKSGDLDSPPRSPDLTPPDFFLWGYLKSKVYVNKPRTVAELKDNIREEIAAIPAEMLKDVERYRKVVIWTGHRVRPIWRRLTSSCGDIWSQRFTLTSQGP